MILRLIAAGVCGWFVVLFIEGLRNGPGVRPQEQAAAAVRQPTKLPLDFELPPDSATTLTVHGWKKDGFGTVAVVDLTIDNRNTYAIKDILVSCYFSGKSGTTIQDKHETIFEIVPMKSKKRIRDFNFGFVDRQASGMRCDITHARRA